MTFDELAMKEPGLTFSLPASCTRRKNTHTSVVEIIMKSRRHLVTFVGGDPDKSAADPYVEQALATARQAEKQARQAEQELRRVRNELDAVRGVLKTVCRIAAPYDVDK
jgi:hypothetical protein